MDAMLKFAFERINEQLTQLTDRVKVLESRCSQFEKPSVSTPLPQQATLKDELVNLRVARTILNVGRNTFLSMVSKGIITPVRMNLRTIRYSRAEIQRFIDQKVG